MLRTTIVIAAALNAILPAMSAQAAGVGRTFLSAAGSDSNNCANVASPCRHLAAAFAATAADGEIYVLDPANYGSLTITHGVSIEGHGWASIAPVSGGIAITINANAGDKINIIGVVLDGTNFALTTGIQFNSGGSLTVQDSVIRNLRDGIDFGGIASTPSQLFVSNTLVSDNGNNGIEISPAGAGTTIGVLDHVKMVQNGGVGLDVSSSNQNVNVTVSDSVSANNGSSGIDVSAGSSALINVMVRNSTIANNTIDGLLVGGSGCPGLGAPNGIIRVSRSTITGNATGWLNMTCGAVISYTDNNIDGNGSANTEPSQLTYK